MSELTLKNDENDKPWLFKEGNPGGPGRPKKTDYQKAYEELLFELVSKEDKPIIEKLIARAKAGDITAIKEINDRILGKAKLPVELGGEVGLPVRIIEVVKPNESVQTIP